MRNVHVERDTDRGEGSSRGGIRLSGTFPGAIPYELYFILIELQ